MALDFPSNPTNGQEYQGYVYSTSVGAWQAKPSAQSPFYTSDTPPANPTKGDSWFNTNDGTMYVYVYDGNTYQWVEHRSQIARSQVGLVPIAPTSIAVGSGTATTGLLGQVSFSSITSLSLNGVFSSNYRNYRAIYSASLSTGAQYARIRFRAAGVDDSTGPYVHGFLGQRISGTTAVAYQSSGNTGTICIHNASASGPQVSVVDFMNPNFPPATASKTWSITGYWADSSTAFGISGAGLNAGSGAADGFTIYPDGGTLSGTIQVYGYNQ